MLIAFLKRLLRGKPVQPTIPDYKKLWNSCLLDPSTEKMFVPIANVLSDHAGVYLDLATKLNIPWFVIFCIHYKEASLNFNTCLHNGDPLPGPTTHVPKGRGPFKSWVDAAEDAINLEKDKFPTSWTIPECLLFLEKYNGTGHRRHGELSPYVWAFTSNSDESGNFVRDGHYDENAPIKTLGCAAIIKFLELKGLL